MGQEEIQNVWFGEKRNTRKLNVAAKTGPGSKALIDKEIIAIKARPPALHCNNGEHPQSKTPPI